nr:acetaldehyde dehydrogenase (acetylating) [Rhodococcus sp. JVH1]EJI97764.1 acetaldehyde dehydrogenase [Rhodococcus sp. JVH1]
MSDTPTIKVAIIGSGNIGTDLMIKVLRNSDILEMGAMVGIDPNSDGLARAARLNVPTTADGVQGLIGLDNFADIDIVFDATSAGAHEANAAALAPHGKKLVDLTPAALGPYVVPPVNLEQHLDVDNVNMVTCGGQATIPMVAAIFAVTPVAYAEIVASIASKSAGPGTRANIDEFTETTSHAIEQVGGAARGKAIIVLNPAEPRAKREVRDTPSGRALSTRTLVVGARDPSMWNHANIAVGAARFGRSWQQTESEAASSSARVPVPRLHVQRADLAEAQVMA